MLYDQIEQAVEFIRRKTSLNPRAAIILGSGLGGLTEQIETACIIPYGDIPHFPVSTVSGHKGQLVFGQLNGVQVVTMAGRFHYYEGYSLQQVTFPVRVMKMLGARLLIASNAAGSVNPGHEVGDLVFIEDHINLLPDNPLRGPNDDRLGPRFPDMLNTYDKELLNKALAIAEAKGYRAHRGVYAVLQGPNFETPAEYTWLHRIGADLAGMSTVPEVLVARHMGMDVFAASVVTDVGYPPVRIKHTSHEEVVQVAAQAGQRLAVVIRELLGNLS
ncbi:MAG: purine-nucleoside phosphorylase [Saprospiraceae bacterium]